MIEERVGRTSAPPSAALSDAAMRAAFCHHFGIGHGSVRVLMALYRAPGPWSADALADIAGSTPVAVRVYHIAVLREALNTEAIDGERRVGYRLTEGGMAECRAALWMMGEELRRAS